jgi:hypothetical protein
VIQVSASYTASYTATSSDGISNIHPSHAEGRKIAWSILAYEAFQSVGPGSVMANSLYHGRVCGI